MWETRDKLVPAGSMGHRISGSACLDIWFRPSRGIGQLHEADIDLEFRRVENGICGISWLANMRALSSIHALDCFQHTAVHLRCEPSPDSPFTSSLMALHRPLQLRYLPISHPAAATRLY
jgi:hypothetical protein